MPTSNSPTALIAALADVDGARAAKIQAFAEELENHQYYGDEEKGRFTVTHKGITFDICDAGENMEGDLYHEESGQFWNYGDHACQVCRTSGFTRLYHNYYFIAGTFKELATKILDLMDDERYCTLCGALFEEMKGFCICQRCALSELPAPCRTCGKKHGRDSYPPVHVLTGLQSREAPEHPMCKKRRLGGNS